MKNLVLTISLYCLSLALFGQTSVSGTQVNQIWGINGSPYHVVGDILVAGLTIEPGVEVVVQGNYLIDVAGVITAIGTPCDTITFTKSDTIASWKGIRFQNSSPGSVMKWCLIEHANSSGIRIIDSYPSLEYCLIQKNSTTQHGAGIKISLTNLEDLDISNCNFRLNSSSTSYSIPASHGGGVWVDVDSGTVRFIDCIIEDNLTYRKDGHTYGGGAWISGNTEFIRCRIQGNLARGQETIPGGSSAGRGGAIYMYDGICSIQNSELLTNTAKGTAAGGIQGNQGYASGGGIHQNNGQLDFINSICSSNIATSSHGTLGGGVYVNTGIAYFENATIVWNSNHGIRNNNGTVNAINSIIYFNTNNGVQLDGTIGVTYSDVQGTYPGIGNINFNPVFISQTNLQIVPGSPCIDTGDTSFVYNDLCFPPALGTARNDMGAHGGPGACNGRPPAPPVSPFPSGFSNTPLCASGSNFVLLDPGTGFVDYLWSTGDTTQTILAGPGPYWVMMTDTCGNMEVDSIEVVPIAEINFAKDTICTPLDSTTTLDPGPNGSSYVWNTGATTQTIDVSQGLYWVMVGDVCGNQVTDSVLIVQAASISFPADTCIPSGSLTTLDPGNSGNSFMWSTGDTTQSIDVSQGLYWVTVGDECGGSITDSILVDVTVSIDIPLDFICIPADSTTVLDPGDGGNYYLWSTGDTTQTVEVSQGYYWVMASDVCNNTLTDTVWVVSKAFVDFIEDTVCIPSGFHTTLDAGKDGNSYLWNTNETTQVIDTSQGLYWVVVSDECGNSYSDSVLIADFASINFASDTINLIHEPFPYLLDPGPNAVRWIWNTNDTSQTILIDTPGIYSVIAYDLCGNEVMDSVLADFFTNISFADRKIQVYPNPFHGQIHIELPDQGTFNELIITAAQGKVVDRLSISGLDKVVWDGTAFPPGLYIASLRGREKLSFKMIRY